MGGKGELQEEPHVSRSSPGIRRKRLSCNVGRQDNRVAAQVLLVGGFLGHVPTPAASGPCGVLQVAEPASSQVLPLVTCVLSNQTLSYALQ